MKRLTAHVEDGLAAFALAYLVTSTSVARPVMNRILGTFLTPDPRPSMQLPLPVQRRVHELVTADVAAGEHDMRHLEALGWVRPRRFGSRALWLGELLDCPTCLSWWAGLAVTVARRGVRPWSARWWLDAFGTWAVAQQMVRLPINRTFSGRDYVRDAQRVDTA